MKKLITLFVTAALAMTASAELADGYYRAQNYVTGRFIYVLDNKGSLNMQATTAELGALELWMGYERTITDPATVIYVKDLDGKQRDFDLQAQGTGVYQIISHAVSIYPVASHGTYYIFGRDSGVTRYISDANTNTKMDEGDLASNQGGEVREWYFRPLTTNDDMCFGVASELEVNGLHYTSLYADFPFQPLNADDTKMFYIDFIDYEKAMAVKKEVSGILPAATPVFFEMKNATALENKLEIGGTPTVTAEDNMLSGLYFQINKRNHRNTTPYDPATMRVLGKMADGSLGLITADIAALPRNRAYITVPEGSPAEIKIMTQQEYMDGVESVFGVGFHVEGRTVALGCEQHVAVYNVLGQTVYNGTASSVELPEPGVYIIESAGKVQKVSVK